MFELSDLSKTYAKSGTKAVDGLSLSVPDGEIFGFLGPNGAGKTTTIKMLTGICRPDSGKALIGGLDVQAEPLAAKRLLSYVPDNPEIFPRLKASEYLDFIGDVYGIATELRRERTARYAKLLKIDEALGAKVSSFSHGMKQKLVLVGSLLPDPDNWILDEPLVGLDPEAAFRLKDLMRERVKAGKTVFFSTHVMEVAEKLCTRLAVIAKGRILFTGTLGELKEAHGRDESLERIFLELVDSDLIREGAGLEK
jgi:ABC-2 type transport system ATP-binding protein